MSKIPDLVKERGYSFHEDTSGTIVVSNQLRAFTTEDKDDTLIIIPSGWAKMYHVIRETPNLGDMWYEHEFLTKEQITKKYGVHF